MFLLWWATPTALQIKAQHSKLTHYRLQMFWRILRDAKGHSVPCCFNSVGSRQTKVQIQPRSEPSMQSRHSLGWSEEWKNQYYEHKLEVLFAYLTEEVGSDRIPGHKSIWGINKSKQSCTRQNLQLSLKSGYETSLQNVRLAIQGFQDPGCSNS